MSNLRIFLVVIALLSMTACSSMKITSKSLADYDWENVKTYAWDPGAKVSATEFPEIDTVTVNKLIRNAINSHLSEQNFKRVGAGDNPDIVVTYLAALKPNIEVHNTPKYYNEEAIEKRNIDPSDNAQLWTIGPPKVVEYTEGAVGVILKDAKTNEELWQGIARAVIDLDASSQKRQRRIDSAVKTMFKNFPN